VAQDTVHRPAVFNRVKNAGFLKGGVVVSFSRRTVCHVFS